MKKYEIDAHGNPVVSGELPLSTAISGEEERGTSVDTSGFGMYSSGTGTGAITGGGMLPDQYATTATAIQTQLPCSLADYSSEEDDGMGGRRKKKGLKETIKEKLVPASGEGMTTGSDGEQGGTHNEKKGLMERIKEKLPGHHHHHHHQ